MTRSYTTSQGDVLDKIARAAGGQEASVPDILEQNAGLSSEPPNLAAGLSISVPESQAAPPAIPIRLWGTDAIADPVDRATFAPVPSIASTNFHLMGDGLNAARTRRAVFAIDFNAARAFSRNSGFHAISVQPITRLVSVLRDAEKLRIECAQIIADRPNTLTATSSADDDATAGWAIQGAVERFSAFPEPRASDVGVVSAVVSDLTDPRLGLLCGVRIESTGARWNGIGLDLGNLVAGDVRFLHIIYRSPDVTSSGQRRLRLNGGPGFEAVLGAYGSASANDEIETISEVELEPNIWELVLKCTASQTAAYNATFGPDSAEAGEAIECLYFAALDAPAIVLSEPDSGYVRPADIVAANVPDPLQLSAQSWRIELQVIADQIETRVLCEASDGTRDNWLSARIRSDHRISLRSRRNGGDVEQVNSSATIAVGQKQVIFVEWRDDGVALEISGQEHEFWPMSRFLPKVTVFEFGSRQDGEDHLTGGILLERFEAFNAQ